MALSKTTQDHDEIRQWAETRGAIPAEVASTETKGQTGILRLEFPKAKNANDSALKEISWDEFFEKFDANGLALVYQEQTAEGEQSNFNKLIYPEDTKAGGAGSSGTKGGAKKAAQKKAPAKKAAAAKKSTGAKKSVGGGSAKKASGSKSPAKSSSASKSAKKAPAKKTAGKSTGAKKAPAKKAATKKSSGKRS